jgi:hypothetical protein
MARRLRDPQLRAGLVLLVVVAAAAFALRLAPTAPRQAHAALAVPHAAGKIALDGELVDPGWTRDARTGPFTTAGGARAFPHSEARITWDEERLYLGLFAADEDIRSSDHFDVIVRRAGKPDARFAFSPKSAGAEADGTIDDASDDDEEWGVEVGIPLADLGAGRGDAFSVRMERCDRPKGSPEVCASWSEDVVLE